MTPQERIQETFRRVLQQSTLRAILRPLGRTPLDVSKSEMEELLAPYEAAIESDYVMCCEVAGQLVTIALAGKDPLREAEVEESESLTLDTEE